MPMRHRVIVAGATLLVFLAVLGLTRMAARPTMALLYSGLDPTAAGQVVQALEQRGVPFAVEGDSIRVDAAQRDSLRMTLAAEGLPRTGTAGYELLDGLSGFGTTAQMFDAAYWRAREGELARTILASPAIRAARVHIAQAPTQPFQRDRKASASVTVTPAGGAISADQARALRHLVAAAVPGLLPEDVAVIDSVNGVVPSNDAAVPALAGDARAAELKRNIERLLSARVGPGRALVEVAVDLDTASESVVERRLDPQGRVVISSDTEENSRSATEPSGAVTVASNLPEGDAGAGAQGSSSQSESRERVNYELSETRREVQRAAGGVRRLSVAVLIDGETVTAQDGSRSFQPRAEAELTALRELVASAAGIDESRGDVLTLKSMIFEPLPEALAASDAGFLAQIGPLDIMRLIQIAVLGLVVLVLALFVLRPLLLSAPARREDHAMLGPPAGAAPEGVARTVLTGEIDDGSDPPGPMIAYTPRPQAAPSPGDPDPVDRLRNLIAERQAESLEILRGWMEAEEERTS
ncbi:flagellar basal-body MS-ring/collar protein FliF [Szabonella alba]|nr:flagellar basal-body MS-ring/collar protein FliF [Szabonella alba]